MPRGVKSGRHRSSSTSSYNDALAVSSVGRGAANLSSPTLPENLESCNKLFELLASDLSSGGAGSGGHFLHQLATIGGGGSSDVSVNELSIAHVLLEKAAQVDRANAERGCTTNKKGKKTNPGNHRSDHMKSLLLAADLECEYTPLHNAVYSRSLRSILLLLRHAAVRVGDEQSADVQLMNRIRLHPILMLDGGESSRLVKKNRTHDDNLLMNMVLAKDAEGLTPLGLLCKSMSADLARCRRYLAQQRLDVLGLAATGRDRSISWVDDNNEDDDDNSDGNDRVGAGRLRGTSFGNIHDVDLDADGVDGVDGVAVAALRGRDNEFGALRGTGRDENAPADDGNGGDDASESDSPRDRAAIRQSLLSQSMCTFGCEVMTFGRADHCALGVPHFASRRLVEDAPATGAKAGSSCTVGVSSSVRPRRVEAFGLGEMGRNFDNNDDENDAECHGSAVAVAAAAHHTLVVTAKGHLMAFGLGKTGRLGTGDENHRPLPTRVLGPLSRRHVVSIAAALNHSLCSTSDGGLYAWGSDRFGQLGLGSASGGGSKVRGAVDGAVEQRCVPRRVESMRNAFVIAVAAGDRHSVALTRRGEVYCWGDNSKGQLGMMLRGESRGKKNGSPGSNNSCCDRPARVDALWSTSPRKRVASIAAAEQSTLVLALPARHGESSGAASLPVNSVFSWGHGNSSPVKIHFPASDAAGRGNLHRQGRFSGLNLNPISISAAKHHNAAITSDGRCFTWGLHSEPLGVSPNEDTDGWESRDRKMKRTTSAGSMVIATPQLVTGLLPENGGGLAIAVSASENHTAVLTESGHLYTWGANEKNDVLGHKGVRYQPLPRRVPGVHRAIGLAAAKEHTVLLIGTSFPSLSTPKERMSCNIEHAVPTSVPSLQALATQEIAKHIDLFNALALLIQAERMGCRTLISHCTSFIRRNLDSVLALAKKKYLDMYLDESVTRFLSLPDNENEDVESDGPLHPLIFELARSGAGETLGEIDADSLEWMSSSKDILRSLPLAMLSKSSLSDVAQRRSRVARSSLPEKDEDVLAKRMEAQCKITAGAVTKSVPGTAVSVESNMLEEKLFEDDKRSLESEESKGPNAASSSQYRCDLCDVMCPDKNALTMHMGGKRHRNRAKQMKEEEKKAAAAAILEAKRRQLLATDQVEEKAQPRAKKSHWKASAEPAVQPRYRLEPPPPPVYESKDEAPGTPAKGLPSWSPASAKFLQSSGARAGKNATNFQSILQEEQRLKKVKSKPHPGTNTVPPKQGPPAHPKMSMFGKVPTPPSSSLGTKKISLGAFLEPKRPPPKKREGPAWSTSPPSTTGPATSNSTLRSVSKHSISSPLEAPRRKTSFNEIQRKEEELKANQDGMSAVGIEGQWYVERRERASSIAAIAQEEEEMHRLIEEQLAIEEQIRQDQASIKEREEKQEKMSSKSKGRGKRSNSRHKSGSGGGRGRGSGGRGRGQSAGRP